MSYWVRLPPSLVMLQLVTAKWVMQAISVAAELGIADLLKDGRVVRMERGAVLTTDVRGPTVAACRLPQARVRSSPS